MAAADTTLSSETEKAIASISASSSAIECAEIYLNSGCGAISAIANAIEVLSALEPKPEKLFNHTITRLAAHAVYLADTVQNDVGCFIETVEVSA